MSDFDLQETTLIKAKDRQNTQSIKWEKFPGDIIPMWVADMDFESPKPIIQALQERVSDGVFGYTKADDSLNQAIIDNAYKQYTWQIKSKDINYLPGLVCALHVAVRAFTKEDEGVIIPGPVYFHLTKAAQLANRTIHAIPMTLEENRWLPDMDAFAKACADSKSKLILLCNPHNPGGTVFNREELTKIHALAKQHDLTVVSDEIHCDLILDEGLKHIPFASLNEDAANRTVTLMAPSKTYNVAGLGLAYSVIQNLTLRNIFNLARSGIMPDPNLLAFNATKSAYTECQDWHQDLIKYLRKNRDLIYQKLSHTQCKISKIEATYLAWIDVSYLKLEDAEAYFLKAGVAISDGKQFGNSNFIRLNFGCSHQQLDQALTRLLKVL
ncbi:putative aminotransferase [Marinomonas sp. MED121]|uniref:MalY/PatB family protein n=1 Tax=Marinomonas sp. MED121 TaxID=314277 RepID=UPI0000690349|nr:PatB family C-S lyase [Marinomonas sp. MED121]EAQ66299.1 putative aminotransferase [Marinomonas sp. MED121]